jgi:hypothetical protein
MELRNRTTGAVITDSQFRSEHPGTSFPKVLTVEILNSFGYDPILEGPQAQTTPPYQISVRDGIEKINGQWFTKYIAGPVFQDYTDDKGVVHTASEQWQAYCFDKDAEQAKAVRADRNKRLAECDWTQLIDTPLDPDGKLAWQLYRETLRMVPEQPKFPWEIQWPPEPGAN